MMIVIGLVLSLFAVNTESTRNEPKPVALWPFTPKYQGANVLGTGDATLHSVATADGLHNVANASLYLTGLDKCHITMPFDQFNKYFTSGSMTVTMYFHFENTMGVYWEIYSPYTNTESLSFGTWPTASELHIWNKGAWVTSPMGTLKLNKWYYLAAVYDDDASSMRIYRNAHLVAETRSPSILPLLGNVYIGWTERSKSGKYHLKGRIFCVQLFNRALSSGQLEQSQKACESFAGADANVAKGKPTKQSSIYQDYYSSRAVDGNTNQNWNFCMHTNSDLEAWWEVDLGYIYKLHTVKIYNILDDVSAKRLSHFDVKVASSENGLWTICNRFTGPSNPGDILSLMCKASGRFVRIQFRKQEYLHICEVEVYAGDDINVAQGKPTKQSSTHENYDSGRAVDGSTNQKVSLPTFMHTLNEAGAWWQVDLGDTYKLRVVKVYNVIGADFFAARLSPFDVQVADDENGLWIICNQFSEPSTNGAILELKCQVTGRYVRIQLRKQSWLHMLEVEVYGTICKQQNCL